MADEGVSAEEAQAAKRRKGGEFDRFEALTRRLVRVPKDEVDRKRDEERARQAQ